MEEKKTVKFSALFTVSASFLISPSFPLSLSPSLVFLFLTQALLKRLAASSVAEFGIRCAAAWRRKTPRIRAAAQGRCSPALFGSMPFLFRSRRRHSTGAASWLIPIRWAVTFLQREGGERGGEGGRTPTFPLLTPLTEAEPGQERGLFLMWSVFLITDGGIMSFSVWDMRLWRSWWDRKHPQQLTGSRRHGVFVPVRFTSLTAADVVPFNNWTVKSENVQLSSRCCLFYELKSF